MKAKFLNICDYMRCKKNLQRIVATFKRMKVSKHEDILEQILSLSLTTISYTLSLRVR